MIPAVLLATARVWALLRVQAGWRSIVGGRWEWICAAIALAIAAIGGATGQVGAIEPVSFVALAISLGFEIALGTTLGLAAALPSWALLGAAAESEHNLELRGPSSLAPLLVAVSLAAALGLGLHRPLIMALMGSFDRFPLASPDLWGPAASFVPWLTERAAAITGLALALATPVLLTRAVIELGIVSLGRVGFEAAQLLDVIGPGLRLVAGLTALGAATSAYPEAFAASL